MSDAFENRYSGNLQAGRVAALFLTRRRFGYGLALDKFGCVLRDESAEAVRSAKIAGNGAAAQQAQSGKSATDWAVQQRATAWIERICAPSRWFPVVKGRSYKRGHLI